MLPFETLATFTGTALLLALTPGPDNLCVLTQSALRGPKTGILMTMGLCTGLLIYSVAVALGVALIFQTSVIAFTLLKTLGAAYLLYLAYKAFSHKTTQPELETSSSGGVARQAYARGILMNLTNPKIAIFFLAFLPQFTSPVWGNVTLQMLELGGIFILCTLLVFSIVALMTGFLSNWLRKSERSLTLLNRAAGVIFVGLALKLALTAQH